MWADDGVLRALAEQHAELARILDGLDESDWAKPTPRCPGWDVSDVVLHLTQTDEMSIGSLEGRFEQVGAALLAGARAPTSVDDGVDLMVEKERGAPVAALHARWTQATTRLRDGFAAIEPSTRVTWVSGQLSARTLATTRLSETWIHTGDVADALGIEQRPGPRLQLIARLAWRTIPYAFSIAGKEPPGPVALHLTGPDGERWDYVPDDAPVVTIAGDAVELCEVAARRRDPSTTTLQLEGPGAAEVLERIRTYAA